MCARCECGGILATIVESMLRGRWKRRHWHVGLQAVVGRGWSTSSELGVRWSEFGCKGGERSDHGKAVAERDPSGDDRSDWWASVSRERSGAQASMQLRGARLTGGPPCQSGARVRSGLSERAPRGASGVWALACWAARGKKAGPSDWAARAGRSSRIGLGCCWAGF